MSCNQEEELVVKWFFNASTTPFYQWVPALDVGPQVHYYVYIWSSLFDKLLLHRRKVLMRLYIYIHEILNGLVFAGDHKGGTRLAFYNRLILKILQF